MSGHGQDGERPPRADFKDAAGWIALGVATLIGSIRMDRLQSQHINPLTIPGLLPGLLGLAMMTLGIVLGVRSWQRGALREAEPDPGPLARAQRKRVAIAIGLCVGFAVVLVGHGLPFWLASSIYTTISILIYRRISPDPDERRIGLRAIAQALVIGVGASVVIWLVFEQLFLVRLP
jgi:hypothetical protein